MDNRIQKATFSLNSLPAIKLNVTKQTGNYHIVAGAFRIEENSKKKVDQLKSLGYPARILGKNRYGLFEVVYSSHETGKDALQAVRDIRKTQNKDAWIKVEDVEKNSAKKKSPSTTNNINNEAVNSAINSPKTSSNIILEKEKTTSTSEMPNIIKIINDIESIESGYYVMLGDHLNEAERDKALSQLIDDGLPMNYLYDSKSGKFFIYFDEKFNDIESANKSLMAKIKSSSHKNLAVVKIGQ